MRCKHFFISLVSIAALLLFGFAVPERTHALFGCIPTPQAEGIDPRAVPIQVDFITAFKLSKLTLENSAQTNKECIGDTVAYMLGQAMIDQLTGSIIDWINNDFEGGPAFVTDPAGFFVGVGDEAAGNFIETQLGPFGALLCSPFDLQLRFNLSVATRASRKDYIGCRLSDIEKGVYDAFTNGSFIASGGWRTWNALTSDPRNNQFGAFLIASDALNTEMVQRANEVLRDLSYGAGFLSKKKCVAQAIKKNAQGGHDCVKYKIETPGSVVQEKLNNTFGMMEGRLQVADEINEVFGALINFGLRQIFSSGGGLRSIGTRVAGKPPPIIAEMINRTPEQINKFAEEDDKSATTTALRSAIKEKDSAEQERGKIEGKIPTSRGTIQLINLAADQVTHQSSLYENIQMYASNNVVNGVKEGGSHCYTKMMCAFFTAREADPYWEVYLSKQSTIKEVRVYAPTDRAYDNDSIGPLFTLTIYNTDTRVQSGTVVFTREIAVNSRSTVPLAIQPIDVVGQTVRIQKKCQYCILGLAEVEVYGTEGSAPLPGSPPSTAVTPPPPPPPSPASSAEPAVSAQRNVELKIDGPVFTVNEPLANVRVGVFVTHWEDGKYKDFAPQQAFGKILVRVKNQATGEVKLEEEFTHTHPTTYRTVKSFSAAAGERVAVGYEFTPTSGAKGSYGLITEIVDTAGVRVPGAASTMTIKTPD